ncbi:ATP-binding protein [Pseudokineococcus marinus]|uniref:ATP-binding protein n=1 Tax=Pseudokineococcus marinus TaxID=351215 RepID=A0A849BLK5_9ACTN|nr:ATP-binding protein [Pseudokineococcus marinus]NNH21947.1 ATP-binding protein [Pseudokineococcus marinus]
MSEADPTAPGARPGTSAGTAATDAAGARPRDVAEEARIEPHPRGASTARALVARLLAPVAPATVVETAVLLTSELTTNAVLHARGEVVVRVEVVGSLVRVEVTDRSTRSPSLQVPRLDASGGRGLVLVEALSSRWGSRLVGGGKAVWFELALDQR